MNALSIVGSPFSLSFVSLAPSLSCGFDFREGCKRWTRALVSGEREADVVMLEMVLAAEREGVSLFAVRATFGLVIDAFLGAAFDASMRRVVVAL